MLNPHRPHRRRRRATTTTQTTRTPLPPPLNSYGPAGGGLLRLHSTYRHDLKIYSSDEGRVQMSAAAFTKGLLDLEGSSLTPILVSLVKKDASMLDAFGKVRPARAPRRSVVGVRFGRVFGCILCVYQRAVHARQENHQTRSLPTPPPIIQNT